MLMADRDTEEGPASHDGSVELDLELIQRIRGGDQQALGMLFDRYSRIVLGIAYRVLRDRGESEELVQDVFLYVHQKASLYNPSRGIVKAWIVQMAYYRALNRRLFLARRRFYDGTDLEGIENNILGPGDPEEDVLFREGNERLEKILTELTPPQRVTLQMFFIEGHTLREISEKTGEPLCNVR